jgi:DNA repair exonuclease SbcCD ATPase subunit
MVNQDKDIKAEAAENEATPEPAAEAPEPPRAEEPVQQPEEAQAEPQGDDQFEKLKETSEKIWGSTVHAFSTASFRASQYKKIVQRKIDLSALHKKISQCHSDLGKLIDDLREAGKKSIMAQQSVKDLLARLDEMKTEAVALEGEIEQLRAEQPPQETSE